MAAKKAITVVRTPDLQDNHKLVFPKQFARNVAIIYGSAAKPSNSANQGTQGDSQVSSRR
jgi:hypothetical protein